MEYFVRLLGRLDLCNLSLTFGVKDNVNVASEAGWMTREISKKTGAFSAS